MFLKAKCHIQVLCLFISIPSVSNTVAPVSLVSPAIPPPGHQMSLDSIPPSSHSHQLSPPVICNYCMCHSFQTVPTCLYLFWSCVLDSTCSWLLSVSWLHCLLTLPALNVSLFVLTFAEPTCLLDICIWVVSAWYFNTKQL